MTRRSLRTALAEKIGVDLRTMTQANGVAIAKLRRRVHELEEDARA